MAYNITLINMPFAQIQTASLALTQLKQRVDQEYAGVRAKVLYLNHDFARYMGIELYEEIIFGKQHPYSGLGDWLFREIAFPDRPDNAKEYFARYYPRRDAATRRFKQIVLGKRKGIRHHFQDLISKYSIADAALVGFTTCVFQTVASIALARMLKALYPAPTIVMGGSNCEDPMGREIVENVDVVDFVFSGPALVSFPAFVGLQLKGDSASCDRIDGVFSRRNVTLQGRVFPTGGGRDKPGVAPLGADLDINTPIPLDYDEFLSNCEEFPLNKSMDRVLQFQTSRGCWWGAKSHCSFCGQNAANLHYRAMAPDAALEQFRSLFKYSGRSTYLQCVDCILPKNYLKEVLPYLDTPEDMTIFYEAKSDLTEHDVRTLMDARVRFFQLGIEAFSTSSLKLLKKGSTSFQNLSLLKHCATWGALPAWNLLIGIPGETEDVYQKYVRDIPRFIHLPPPTAMFSIRFDRYSPYFEHQAAYGLDLHPYDYYELVYPFSPNSLNNLAYFFMDHRLGASYFAAMMAWSEQLKELIELWQTRWHQEDPERLPRLELRAVGDVAAVFDSRSGKDLTYALPESCVEVLTRLDQPAAPDRLAAEFGPRIDSDMAIACLSDHGLLFEEGGRYLSLVLPGGGFRK